MDVNFKFNEPKKAEPIRIEQVFAEKPGGGMVANQAFDVLPTTAVGLGENGLYTPIKAYRLVDAVGASDTFIKIEKGSGVAVNDFIACGTMSVKATAVDASNADFDKVTVTMGVEIAKGTVLYQAASASASSAAPIVTPVYVTGNYTYANEGDQAVRLINGANLRKETANISSEVAALLPMINLV